MQADLSIAGNRSSVFNCVSNSGVVAVRGVPFVAPSCLRGLLMSGRNGGNISVLGIRVTDTHWCDL